MSEHFVDFRYSKDGGHNWSNWRQCSLGQVGAFQRRVVMRRFGSGRQWVFHIRDSSAYRRDLLTASMQIEGER